MEKAPEVVDPNEITDLPAFNDFQRKAREFGRGHATWEAVEEAQQTLDGILASMLFQFHEDLRFQPETRLLVEASNLLYEEFNLLRVHLPLAAKAAQAHQEEAFEEQLGEARESVTTIFQALDRLRLEESGKPRFSEHPLTHELIRVGQLVLEEVLPVDLLRERFAQFVEYHENLSNGLLTLSPSGPELSVWESSQDTLAEALDTQMMGLESMALYLNQGDPLHLEDALDMIGRASDWLVAVQRALTRLPEQEGSPCPRCSGCNPPGQRYCQHCQALLPTSVAESSSFALGEGGASSESPLGEHVQKLADTVHAFESGRCRTAELLEAVDALRARVERAGQGLERIPDPPEETPADQRLVFEEAWEALRAGLEAMREGLDELARERLTGLEKVLGAALQLQDIPKLWAQWGVQGEAR